MDKRQAFIDAARALLGTQFTHQGRNATRGVDCVGLAMHAAKEAGLLEQNFDYTAYGKFPPADKLTEVMRSRLIVKPIHEAKAGDLLRFHISGSPIHIGIKTDVGVIHSLSRRGVIEHVLDDLWASRIVEVYQIPGIEE